LVERFGAVVALKGSGTVIATAHDLPRINPTGNALLATAGTGDVLAGMIGARLAFGLPADSAAAGAVYAHGLCADLWSPKQTLVAGELAQRIG
jgi:NAD(P)H-hydrate repair Nnr-like enzyme with NAD(P)H-hydrate dehydratase domain